MKLKNWLTSKCVVRHTEESEAIGLEDMKDVSILRKAHPGLGIVRELLQDPAGDGAGVAGHGGELRKNDSTPRHHGVEDRHRRSIEGLEFSAPCYWFWLLIRVLARNERVGFRIRVLTGKSEGFSIFRFPLSIYIFSCWWLAGGRVLYAVDPL